MVYNSMPAFDVLNTYKPLINKTSIFLSIPVTFPVSEPTNL
jgi:hypothetical protein